MFGLKFEVSSRNITKGDLLTLAGIWAVILVASVILYFFNPETSILYPPCPFHYITGLHCPGCGSARALHQLVQGNFLKAFDFNPLMIISLPFLIYVFISFNFLVIRGYSLPELCNVNIWPLFYIVIFYWVARNIPYPPFSFLAP